MADRVSRIINDHGIEIEYQRTLSVSRNATTLTRTEVSDLITLNAAVRLYRAFELSGLVQQGDRELRIGAAQITFEPVANDRIFISEKEYNVISVDKRSDRGNLVLYLLQIRGVQ